ncbi:MAG: LysR family transcriptional regulator [Pseudomonadota bacterium]
MKLRDFPPLAALRAFAAYVETGHVAEAGAALGVSHAAVSQQLKQLERHLGVALFDRSARAMQLTADGEILAQGCRDGFGSIGSAIDLVTGTEAARPLHVSPTPSFAAAWLMPRLPEFRAAHPGTDIILNPTAEQVNPQAGAVDLSIRYGQGPWPGLDSRLLMATPMVVVAAPRLVTGHRVHSVEDLSHLPWLEELGTTEGTAWLTRRGIAAGVQGPLTQVPGNLILDGARDGQGVAVTVRLFVEADLKAGRLVVIEEEDRPGAGYHLVMRPGVQRPPLRAFLRWIQRAARDSG